MGTAKPLISILMAVYDPRMDWLREQLESLNAQTYPNLRLYVRDDHSPNVRFEDIEQLVAECITNFPYEIARNEENLGSNLTFERLTREAEGEYFAYCDQDDVWLPEKLGVLQEAIEREKAELVCSDMLIIDETGEQTASSISEIRKKHRFRSGEGLAEGLICHNFVTGCTMLVRSDRAKAAMPFCPHMVHDHYLALCCAEKGKIVSLEQRLIKYRQHGSNQTGLMAGVSDKASYKRVRIDEMAKRIEWLSEHFECNEELKERLREGVKWARARQRNWERKGGAGEVWKYRGFSKQASLFEIFGSRMPEKVFAVFPRMYRRGWI